MRVIELVSPDGAKISGFLTQSGGVCPVECRYSRDGGEHFYFFEIPAGAMDTLATSEGARVFIDEHGKHWATGDVTYASTPAGA